MMKHSVILQRAAFFFALGGASLGLTIDASAQPSTPAPVEPTPGASPLPSPTASPLRPAGVIPRVVPLWVTGDPAEPQFLRRAAGEALMRAIGPTLQAGARVEFGTLTPAPEAVAAGSRGGFTIPVTIAGGPDLARVDGSALVVVDNAGLPPFVPPLLRLDDDPEYIRADGVLFRGTVDATHPARIYYYHANTSKPRRFLVGFAASREGSARVHLIDAPAGPDPDVMQVGHNVSRTFLLERDRNEGFVFDVSSDPLWYRDVSLGAADGVAGAMDLNVLSGMVTVTILAVAPDADPASYLVAADLPRDGYNRHGTFSLDGYGTTIVAYTVGGPDASLTYGDREPTVPSVNPSDPGRDIGDYGVLRHITFDIDNPADTTSTIYLYERPLGGVVRSSFLVDGELHEVGCARLPNRYLIASLELAPRAERELHVRTMADGGSAYPLEVGVTTTPPQPATPPIDAPEGCFPKP